MNRIYQINRFLGTQFLDQKMILDCAFPISLLDLSVLRA
jgi:hypothetical protein